MSSPLGDPGITFDAPPVFEVALSVQFEDLPITAAHYGLYWAQVRARYPTPIEQAPIDPVIERFVGVQLDNAPQLRILDKPDTPRMWFVSADGTELIQLQRNRFVRNWRVHGGGSSYPRYPVLRERFVQDFTSFVEFAEREGLGDIAPTQVEVTYINHVPALEGEHHTRPTRHFAISALPELYPGDQFEDERVIAKWVMREDGNPIGRLHVDLRPAYVTENKAPVWNLNLVARGAPLHGEGPLDGVLSFMDHGRARIALAFKALTTEAMHGEWRLR